MNVLLLALLAVTPLSVRDSGAKGDGTANDGPAIQAALSQSDWVYFPAGTYLTGQEADPRDRQSWSRSSPGVRL